MDDVLIAYGGEIKSLGGGRVGGYGVLFGTAQDPDLAGDFFSAETDFGPHQVSAVYYDHGLDGTVKRRVLDPTASLRADAKGIWVEAQISARDEYEKDILALVDAGKLGWSSGTAAHLVEREPVGKAHRVTRWPLGLDMSLTPTPCEPRTCAVSLKSLIAQRAIGKSTGLSMDDKRTLLLPLVKQACPCDGDDDRCYGPWICDMYDASVVWECCGANYEATYAISDGTATLGEAKPVVRRVQYIPADGMRSLAGRTLEAHSEAVLAAVEELTARVQSVKALREVDGRTISEASRARCAELRDRLDALATATKRTAAGSDVRAALVEIMAAQAEVLRLQMGVG